MCTWCTHRKVLGNWLLVDTYPDSHSSKHVSYLRTLSDRTFAVSRRLVSRHPSTPAHHHYPKGFGPEKHLKKEWPNSPLGGYMAIWCNMIIFDHPGMSWTTGKFSSNNWRKFILPKTNIAPENAPSEKETIVFQPPSFRGENVGRVVWFNTLKTGPSLKPCKSWDKLSSSIGEPDFFHQQYHKAP